MPIFHGTINEAYPFSYQRFIYHEKIPTASLLLRMRTGDSPDIGTQDAAIPEFKRKTYSTLYMQMADNEVEIMNHRRK